MYECDENKYIFKYIDGERRRERESESESESPTTSNPGPMLAEVAGTVMVKERFDMTNSDSQAIVSLRDGQDRFRERGRLTVLIKQNSLYRGLRWFYWSWKFVWSC